MALGDPYTLGWRNRRARLAMWCQARIDGGRQQSAKPSGKESDQRLGVLGGSDDQLGHAESRVRSLNQTVGSIGELGAVTARGAFMVPDQRRGSRRCRRTSTLLRDFRLAELIDVDGADRAQRRRMNNILSSLLGRLLGRTTASLQRRAGARRSFIGPGVRVAEGVLGSLCSGAAIYRAAWLPWS